MDKITYYIVDVFATNKYEGNQLAVFLDLENRLSDDQMQQMAKEINFAETTFIKARQDNQRFVVRIFTPEHEVPFAGHPSIGTSYIIAKFLSPTVPATLTLALTHSDITITVPEPDQLDTGIFFMRQAQPEFRDTFTHEAISEGLAINLTNLDRTRPIQEISTGLPYILIPIKDLASLEKIDLNYQMLKEFLLSQNKYRTNSKTGHSTSLFFFTKETVEPDNSYHARMLLIENNKLSEDAATGSANGCLLAYLLANETTNKLKAVVEQGFEINRKSYLYLDGELVNGDYQINVGGRNKLISEGIWYI